MLIARQAAAIAALIVPLGAATRPLEPPRRLTDAEIVGIFDAANTWDVSTGTLASTKGASKEVRDFGAMLVRDHKSLRSETGTLTAKLKLSPAPVPLDYPLQKDFDATMKRLNGLSGTAFDRAFLEHEASYHRSVIDAVQKELLPAIENQDLKALVEKSAPNFDAHLKAAENLLKKVM